MTAPLGEGTVDGLARVVRTECDPRPPKGEANVVLAHDESDDFRLRAIGFDEIEQRVLRRLPRCARDLVEPLADVLLQLRVHHCGDQDPVGSLGAETAVPQLLFDPRALRGIVEARDHRVDARLMGPVRHVRVEPVPRGIVRIHVRGDVDAGGARVLETRQHFAHLSPRIAARHLQVPHLDRDARLAADGDGLVERGEKRPRLAANVCRVDPPVARRHFR